MEKWRLYLREKTEIDEITFVANILDFITQAKKKYSDMDIKLWTKHRKKITDLDLLAKKLGVKLVDIRSRIDPSYSSAKYIHGF